ncbi:hypothetical protein [Fischerella thermalis]|uniref:hypothetical protein n=1 Tax=Fischerella thermalis TaxID=372787 RepID=UPI000C803E64|nr:hypothetical protein [Fischerella thermalis]PLZ86465.1 hypothetical protein CI593_18690 [Fischerella thermalis CCMEE 5194]
MKGKFLTLTGTALTLALTSNIAAAQITKFPELSQQQTETTAKTPEIKLSPEGMKILCEYFPLNSRCQGTSSNTTTPDSTTTPAPDSTTPAPDSTTTPAPDSTTPEDTTPSPDSTSPTQITPAPDSTVPAPDSTTPSPDSMNPTQMTPGSGTGTGN